MLRTALSVFARTPLVQTSLKRTCVFPVVKTCQTARFLSSSRRDRDYEQEEEEDTTGKVKKFSNLLKGFGTSQEFAADDEQLSRDHQRPENEFRRAPRATQVQGGSLRRKLNDTVVSPFERDDDDKTSMLDPKFDESRKFYFSLMTPKAQRNETRTSVPLTIERVFGVDREEALAFHNIKSAGNKHQNDPEVKRLMEASATSLFQKEVTETFHLPQGPPSVWTKEVLWKLPWVDRDGMVGLFTISKILSVDSFAPKDVVVGRIMAKISELESAVLNRIFNLQQAQEQTALASDNQTVDLQSRSQGNKEKKKKDEPFTPRQKPGFSPMDTHNFYRLIRSQNFASLHSEAISSFILMKELGVPYNTKIAREVITACGFTKQADLAEKIFQEMLRLSEVDVSFDELLENDNAKLEKLKLDDLNDPIIKKLELNTSHDLHPNNYIYSSMINCFCRAGQIEKAENFLNWLIERANNVELRLKAKAEILSKKYSDAPKPQRKAVQEYVDRMNLLMKVFVPDTVSFTTLIRHFVYEGLHDRAYNIFTRMGDCGRMPDIVTITLMIQSCYRNKEAERAFHYWGMCGNMDIEPTEMTYYQMMRVLSTRPDYAERALEFFEKMKDAGFVPSYRSYHAALGASVTLADLDKCELILKEMEKEDDEDLKPKVASFTFLLRAISAKCPSLFGADQNPLIEKARMIFETCEQEAESLTYPDKHNTIDTAFINSYLGVYAACSRVNSAFECLRLFDKHNTKPDATTFTMLLNLCASTRRYQTALEIWQTIVEDNITPHSTTYAAFMRCLVRGGMINGALKFLRLMIHKGVKIERDHVVMLIRRCVHEKRAEQALEIKELIWHANPELRLFFSTRLRNKTVFERHLKPLQIKRQKRMNPGRLRQRMRRVRRARSQKILRKKTLKRRASRPKKTSVI